LIQWTVWPRAGGPISRLSEGCRPRASGPGCCESWQVIGHAVIVITPVRFDLKSMCCILLGQPSRTSKQAFQTSLLSIYIYIYTPGSSDPASLPSMSSEQVFQASLPSIYIQVFQQVCQAISTIPHPWSSSDSIKRPNRIN